MITSLNARITIANQNRAALAAALQDHPEVASLHDDGPVALDVVTRDGRKARVSAKRTSNVREFVLVMFNPVRDDGAPIHVDAATVWEADQAERMADALVGMAG